MHVSDIEYKVIGILQFGSNSNPILAFKDLWSHAESSSVGPEQAASGRFAGHGHSTGAVTQLHWQNVEVELLCIYIKIIVINGLNSNWWNWFMTNWNFSWCCRLGCIFVISFTKAWRRMAATTSEKPVCYCQPLATWGVGGTNAILISIIYS